MRSLHFLLALCLIRSTHAADSSANPIRKVVTLLQNMVKKVEDEGEKEQALFKKFQCYCKTGGGDLSKSIAAAEKRIPEIESSLDGAQSKHFQNKEALKQHKTDREAAKNAIQKAQGIRTKENNSFKKNDADLQQNIKALGLAISAMEKGGSFLQTSVASTVKNIVMIARMSDVDRQDVLAFLSSDATSYAPSSSILGILKELKAQMEGDHEDLTNTEKDAVATFNDLKTAKTREIGALTSSIEKKSQLVGELAVSGTELTQELEDTKQSLAEDSKFLKDLQKNCGDNQKLHEQNVAVRAEELVALHDVIKVLNDDDALDLFKNTLPGASAFMQIQESTSAVRRRALKIVKDATSQHPHVGLDFISLALSGKKVGFEKVITMIDEMVVTLKTEQKSDDDKKVYCEKEFDSTDDTRKSLEQKSADLEVAIENNEASIETLSSDIKALKESIAALDKSVAEATEQRKSENEEHKALIAADTTAKQVLDWAKNRLNKFYNPKLHTTTAGPAISEEERINLAMGGTTTTQLPGGIAGTGIGAFVDIREHNDAAPPPAPEAVGAYKKKGEESNGVIAMIDVLIAELSKEMQEANVEEKNAQEEYEQMMTDSRDKRANDSKSLEDKTSAKANAEADLEANKEAHKTNVNELMATMQEISALHAECDWLVKYFSQRKDARDGEIEALGNAKAVLSGADYSFVQVAKRLRGSK